MNKNYSTRIDSQYSSGSIEAEINRVLETEGKKLADLTLSDLAAMDEIHIGGRKATLSLAAKANLSKKNTVLDVGAGIGGPARTLAANFDCQVTGLDLTKEYCQIAELLTQTVGLEEKVTFHQADALDMPFENESFDTVWSQHCSMNIENKALFYEEIFRVLEKGGRLIIHDTLANSGEHLDYPVPWASQSNLNFLNTETDMQSIISNLGFKQKHWQDKTEEAIAFYQKLIVVTQKGKMPALNVKLILKTDPLIFAENMIKNLSKDKISVVEAIYQK